MTNAGPYRHPFASSFSERAPFRLVILATPYESTDVDEFSREKVNEKDREKEGGNKWKMKRANAKKQPSLASLSFFRSFPRFPSHSLSHSLVIYPFLSADFPLSLCLFFRPSKSDVVKSAES